MNNGLKNILIFLSGAAIGGAAAWYFTKKYYEEGDIEVESEYEDDQLEELYTDENYIEETYDDIADQYKTVSTFEIIDGLETLDKKFTVVFLYREKNLFKEKKENSEGAINYYFEEIHEEIIDILKQNKVVYIKDSLTKRYFIIYDSIDIYNEQMEQLETKEEKKEWVGDQKTREAVQLLTEDEYGQTDNENTEVLLYYGDDVLADEYDSIVELDKEESGYYKEILDNFKTNPTLERLYVRNNIKEVDYVILKSDRLYSEVVGESITQEEE